MLGDERSELPGTFLAGEPQTFLKSLLAEFLASLCQCQQVWGPCETFTFGFRKYLRLPWLYFAHFRVDFLRSVSVISENLSAELLSPKVYSGNVCS